MARATRRDMTSVQVCRDIGITYRMLDYWCRTGIAGDDPAQGSGSSRRFDAEAIERLRFAAAMTHAGIGLPRVRAALEDPRDMAALVADLERSAALARAFVMGQDGPQEPRGRTENRSAVS